MTRRSPSRVGTRKRNLAQLPKADTPELVAALQAMLACEKCGARPPAGHGERSKCPNATPAPVTGLQMPR